MADLARYLVHARLSAHRRKVDRAREILRAAATRGPMVVSTSWGKDSVALADLALETLGPVPLLHLASSYRLPGWESVESHFRARTEVHEVAPGRTLSEMIAWLHEVGLGYERTTTHGQGAAKRGKHDAGTAWCVDRGIAVQALGMRAEESKHRRRCFAVLGPTYRLATGLYITNPLAWWSTVDVWAYIASRGIPYHPLYDRETHGQTRETLRNAGWLTTIAVERIAWLRAHYPEQYRALAREFPQVTQLA